MKRTYALLNLWKPGNKKLDTFIVGFFFCRDAPPNRSPSLYSSDPFLSIPLYCALFPSHPHCSHLSRHSPLATQHLLLQLQFSLHHAIGPSPSDTHSSAWDLPSHISAASSPPTSSICFLATPCPLKAWRGNRRERGGTVRSGTVRSACTGWRQKRSESSEFLSQIWA